MLVTCRQPELFPPVYSIARMAACDRVIFMGQAQFDRKCFQPQMCDVPGGKKLSVSFDGGSRASFDRKIMLGRVDWTEQLYDFLWNTYGGDGSSNLWYEVKNLLRYIDNHPWMSAAQLGYVTTSWCLSLLGSDAKAQLQTDTGVLPRREENASLWMAQLTEKVGGTRYVQGLSGLKSYVETERFRTRGIKLLYQDYPFSRMKGSNPEVSFLHHLFAHGLDATKKACTRLNQFEEYTS